MNEFKDKLNSSELVGNAIVEISHNKADVGLLIEAIRTVFNDWQPQKPLVVVPQFVADWFKDRMGGTFSAVVASYSFNDDEAITWVHDNGGLDLLCKMKLYDYTVEKPKEKLYFVKLPGVRADLAYLCKSCSPGELGYLEKYSSKEPNKNCFSSRYDKKYYGGWQRQFTEPEVKAIDERFWAFAVPVEDEEMK